MPKPQDCQMRPEIAALAASLAASADDPQSKVVLKILNQPISMSFVNPTPLDDVLKYIHLTSHDKGGLRGISIHLDPKGLK